MLTHEIIEAALVRCGYSGPSQYNKAQARKIKTLFVLHLHPSLKHSADGKHKCYAELRNRLVKPWIEYASRHHRHGCSHRERHMDLIDHAVRIAEIDYNSRYKIIPWQIKSIRIVEAGSCCIESLVRHRDRLARAACGAGCMQYDRSISAVLRRIADRMSIVGREQAVHVYRSIQSFEVCILGFLYGCQRRIDRRSLDRHMQYQNIIDAKLLTAHQQIVDDIGLSKVIRNYKVSEMLAFYRIEYSLWRQSTVSRHERYSGADHIEAVYRKDDFSACRAEYADPRTIPGSHSKRREDRSISLPLTEHESVSVFTASVHYSYPVKISDRCVVHIPYIFPDPLILIYHLPCRCSSRPAVIPH